MNDTEKVRWLFLDLNAYFASVEQQEIPALRGKPVAVVPMMADSTCCIAASYEAKAFGIRCGTLVREAKVLCPEIRLIEARHDLYVRYHHAIVDAVESCVPVAAVLSIDEMASQLLGSQKDIPNAQALAAKIKATIARQVGPYMKSSIGLAPNRFLAKLASDMQKPDGLTVIREMDLPHILYKLELRDLPGIGARMEKHLHEHGIYTMEELCRLSKAQTHAAWGGIVGEHFYAWLRGEVIRETPTQRRSISHSHVLEPEARTRTGAFKIAQKLVTNACIRLRKMDYWAGGLWVGVGFLGDHGWDNREGLDERQDTPTFLAALNRLWKTIPNERPIRVSAVLYPLIPRQRHTPSLFENPKQELLSKAMDQINARYGHYAAYYASLFDTKGKAPTRIAFTSIPDLSSEF